MIHTDGRPTIAWSDGEADVTEYEPYRGPHELAQTHRPKPVSTSPETLEEKLNRIRAAGLETAGPSGCVACHVVNPGRSNPAPDLVFLKRKEVRKRLNRAVARTSISGVGELLREAFSANGFDIGIHQANNVAAYLLGEEV